MKKLLFLLFCVTSLGGARAENTNFDRYFRDSTLRVDYILTGNASEQQIALYESICLPGWAGRRHNLDRLPLAGNGSLEMHTADGKLIYETSFSTLFQEWLVMEEAQNTARAFDLVLQLPYPKEPVSLTVKLKDMKGVICAQTTHPIDPADILIRKPKCEAQWHYLHQGGSPAEAIDVAIVAEGYTAEEMGTFEKDARAAMEALFSHEPFKTLKERFNLVAVPLVSQESGVSEPLDNVWRETPAASHFSTFYSDRYLTTRKLSRLYDRMAGIPFEHLIILANTDTYGGGGIYNSYTLTTAHHAQFRPVVVHEFGHSFGGLADEYYDDTLSEGTYHPGIEPWEPNITTLTDFDAKWRDMLPKECPVPTPVPDVAKPKIVKQGKRLRHVTPEGLDDYPIGVYEGAGYNAHGVYRPALDCRMKTNAATKFCPVCQRALERLIRFYTE